MVVTIDKLPFPRPHGIIRTCGKSVCVYRINHRPFPNKLLHDGYASASSRQMKWSLFHNQGGKIKGKP